MAPAQGASQRRGPGRPRATEQGPSKARAIRRAAITEIARTGFADARVSDIAAAAGVAPGLIYHYYPGGKAALLSDITSSALRNLAIGVAAVAETSDAAPEQVRAVISLVLGWCRIVPDIVRIVVLEVTRSSSLRSRTHELVPIFESFEQIIRSGQGAGTIRADLEPRIVAHIFWGAVEEVITGLLLETLPADDAGIDRAEATLSDVVHAALGLKYRA